MKQEYEPLVRVLVSMLARRRERIMGYGLWSSYEGLSVDA